MEGGLVAVGLMRNGIRLFARNGIRLLAVTVLLLGALFALPVAVSAQTASSGSSVGAVVVTIPTTTTQPPPTTAPPAVTVPTPVSSVPNKGAEEDATTGADVVSAPAEQPAVEIQEFPAPPEDKGVMGAVKSAVESTKKLFKGVLNGKPVADAVQEALPAPVAAVVVPAVRTASTFAFPIGLAAGVFAFLILQQRIDSSDPKLTAAPLAHDDDVIEFR